MSNVAYSVSSGVANYIDLIRADIGDDDSSSYTYTDSQMVELVKKSLMEINAMVGTTFEYFPTSSGIAPTPSDFQAMLVVSNVECMIARRERNTASRTKGIRIEDSDTVLDLTGATGATNRVVEDICGRFAKLLGDYVKREYGVEDNAKIIWAGNTRLYEDVDNDGTASEYRKWANTPYDRPGGIGRDVY